MTKRLDRKETLIRAHYAEQGDEVRISRDGHIKFRRAGADEPWREGRFVSEYEIISGDTGADVRLR